MRENMTEGLKRSIYHELATHEVTREEFKPNWGDVVLAVDFNFGKYRVTHHGSWVTIDAYDANLKRLWLVARCDCPKYISNYDNDIYKIYVAAKNKAEGKPYIDPYKIPAKDAIKDSQKRFAKQMKESAADFLPYDMPKQLALRTIAEMKQVLTKNLNKHYNGKNR